jgi:hypothetical protein
MVEEIFFVVGVALSVALIVRKNNKIGILLLVYWCLEFLYDNSFLIRGTIGSLLYLGTIIFLCLSMLIFNKKFWKRGL